MVLKNLSRIIDGKKRHNLDTPIVRWKFLAFDWNTGELEPARKRANELGCDEFVVKKGEIFEPYAPLLEYRDNSFMDAMTRENQEKMTRCCEDKAESREYFGCDLLYHQLVIHSDGTIHPCTYYHAPRQLYGSVHLKKDVFNTAHYKNARRMFVRPPPKECQGYDPCLNCAVVTDEMHGGYVPDGLDFFTAFRILTGEPFGV